MTDKTRSHGLWEATAPPPPEIGSLEGEVKTGVAVVGGGYTGLSAALHLADAGTDVVVLEAREIGFGGAGRNVGLVNAGLWLMPEDVVRIVGESYGERLITSLGASPDLVYALIDQFAIQCEPVRNGTLHCAHSPGGYKALEQRETQWRRRGAPVALLDREAAAEKIGSRAFLGALLDKRAGTVQPLAYAYGLAAAAAEAGAVLYDRSPVMTVARQSGRWVLSTPSGNVTAEAVIVAVHGYADHAFTSHRKGLIPFNFFQFATPPLPEAVRRTILPGGHGAWDTALILSSYRLDRAGRLIVGSVGQVENLAYGLHAGWARRTIRAVFPQAGGVPLEHGWHGRIAMTVDHVPRFHILGPGMVTVTSYNGRGIGPGTLFGKLLAKYIHSGDERAIPLPVRRWKPLITRGARGLFYELGARAYHLLQRRVF
jgi:glycine/D-amino acid oxidase-like deaminating enzyme